MYETPTSMYLGHPADWAWLGDRLLRSEEVNGLDSETIGCNPRREQAIDFARVVAWSVGIAEGALRPRGYREAEGFVLPPGALDDPSLREWLTNPRYKKVAHNCRYDRHVFANAGVDVGGLVDTVDLFRVVSPGRERYGLKMIVPDVLAWSMYGDFEDLFSEPIVRESVKTKRAYVCVSHGDADRYRKRCEVCRDVLVVVDREIIERKELKARRKIPLQEVCGIPVTEYAATERITITPHAHRLWELFVNYAGADAIGAAQLYQARHYQLESHRRAKLPDFGGR